MKSGAMGAVRRLAQANILLAVVTFTTGAILAHALGPAGRGELAKLILWPTVLCHLALLGVHLHLARETARETKLAFGNYRLGFGAVMSSATVAMAAYSAIAWLAVRYGGASMDIKLALVAALMIPAGMWCAFQTQMELGRQNTATFNFVRYSFALSNLVMIASLYFIDLTSVAVYLSAFVAANIFAAVTSHLMIARTLPRRKEVGQQAASHQNLLGLLSASRPYGFSVALNAIAASADKLLVSLFFEARTMGLYVVAVTIAQLQNIMGEAISQIFFSKIALNKGLEDIDNSWLALRLRQTVIIYVVLGGLIAIVAGSLVQLIFGAKFSGATDLLYMLIPSITLQSARRPFEEVLKAGGLPLKQAQVALITTTSFAMFGSIAALMGSMPFMLLALFFSSLLGFVMIARVVAVETAISIRQLVIPRPSDLVHLITQVRQIVRV